MKKIVFSLLLVILSLSLKAQPPGIFVYVIVRDSLCIGDSCATVIMNDTLINPEWVRQYVLANTVIPAGLDGDLQYNSSGSLAAAPLNTDGSNILYSYIDGTPKFVTFELGDYSGEAKMEFLAANIATGDNMTFYVGEDPGAGKSPFQVVTNYQGISQQFVFDARTTDPRIFMIQTTQAGPLKSDYILIDTNSIDIDIDSDGILPNDYSFTDDSAFFQKKITVPEVEIEGKSIVFNESEGVFDFETGSEDVTWQGPLEDLILVYNNTGQTLANGTPVFFSGSHGDSIPTVGIASANNFGSIGVIGLVTEEILNNDYGFVCQRGKVRDVDTDGLGLAGPLYLSEDSSYTKTKPEYPSDVIIIGGVIKDDLTTGIIEVNISGALQRPLATKDYSFTSNGIGAGTYFIGGNYNWSATDANLTGLSSIGFGTALSPHSSHAAVVCGGAGSASGGIVGLRVTGASINDAGVLTIGDADTIISDITAVALNEYYEAKKFVGSVTFELITISGSPTGVAFDFNYGLAKYEDVDNNNFYVIGVETTGLAGANDTGYNFELLHHSQTGWTYAATGFVPGNGIVTGWQSVLAPYDNLITGEEFAFKRTGINQFIEGSESEGILLRITTGQNNSIQSQDIHISVAID